MPNSSANSRVAGSFSPARKVPARMAWRNPRYTCRYSGSPPFESGITNCIKSGSVKIPQAASILYRHSAQFAATADVAATHTQSPLDVQSVGEENEIALEYRKLFRALRPRLPATNRPNNHASHARRRKIAAAIAGSPTRRPARFRLQHRHLAHAHQTPRASANWLDLLGRNARHRSRPQSLGWPRPTRRNRSRRPLRPLRRPHSVSLQSRSPSVEPDFLKEQ